VADEATFGRAVRLGLPAPDVFLAANDSTAFFAPLGDLIVTGPTGTNVADIAVLLAGSKRGSRGPRRADYSTGKGYNQPDISAA
jgi:hypothetical protein